MKRYPQEPKEWDDPKMTLFHEFNFRSNPDIQVLMRLVKENISDRGNSSYLRARLLGILRSYYERTNKRFWLQHYNPKTWWWRYHFNRLSRYVHRKLNTKFYKGEVNLCQIAKEVINEEKPKLCKKLNLN